MANKIKLWEGVPPMYNEELDREHNKDCPYLENYIIKDGKEHSCFVVCPGGGYDHRASDHEGENVAEKLNELGISAVVLNYRVHPYLHPVEINDAKRAIRYLRYNAKEFNIDKDKIGIMGFSAGAHLAVSVAEHYDKFDFDNSDGDEIDRESAKPNALGLCYPVITLTEGYRHERSVQNLLGEDKSDLEIMSAEKSARADMPPTFVWHTMGDTKVDCRHSINMVLALKEKGVDTEFHLFNDGEHGMDLAEDIEGTNQWFGLFTNWLKRKGFCI